MAADFVQFVLVVVLCSARCLRGENAPAQEILDRVLSNVTSEATSSNATTTSSLQPSNGTSTTMVTTRHTQFTKATTDPSSHSTWIIIAAVTSLVALFAIAFVIYYRNSTKPNANENKQPDENGAREETSNKKAKQQNNKKQKKSPKSSPKKSPSKWTCKCGGENQQDLLWCRKCNRCKESLFPKNAKGGELENKKKVVKSRRSIKKSSQRKRPKDDKKADLAVAKDLDPITPTLDTPTSGLSLPTSMTFSQIDDQKKKLPNEPSPGVSPTPTSTIQSRTTTSEVKSTICSTTPPTLTTTSAVESVAVPSTDPSPTSPSRPSAAQEVPSTHRGMNKPKSRGEKQTKQNKKDIVKRADKKG